MSQSCLSPLPACPEVGCIPISRFRKFPFLTNLAAGGPAEDCAEDLLTRLGHLIKFQDQRIKAQSQEMILTRSRMYKAQLELASRDLDIALKHSKGRQGKAKSIWRVRKKR